QWVSTSNSPKLAELIAQSALTNFQLRQPVSLLEQTQKWLRDERVPVRNFGFLVLEQVSLTISFQDFPLVLKVISPYLKRCPPQNFAAFTAICNNLITKSPKEMAHLMRTVLQENPAAQLKKLIRSCLKTFPPELQKDLLTAIQERT
ncbi:MAG: hypothetical protein RML93_05615, partial [Anaerolineales bacterium]|nr:hypothetical protein [Anaerolineales bacterium]MDW8446753.1 hypothetical protein [Anaerolineales bacterium]